jgi:exodeoxyribonuclease V alpha subunit
MKVSRVRWYEDNWGILEVEPIEVEYGLIEDNGKGVITIKGLMPRPNYIDTYTIIAKEVVDPQWGKQYDLLYMGTPMNLTDENEQRIFLQNILTPTQFKNLYDTLDNPFEAIKNEDIKQLTTVKGIGAIIAARIIEKYKDTIDYSKAYVELDKYGLTPRMIEKLIVNFGSPDVAVEKINNDPYILADEVDGIGFAKADAIALKSGIDPFSVKRVRAFINFYLEQQAYQGYSWVTPNALMSAIITMLGNIPKDIINETIYYMKDKQELYWNSERTFICLRKYFELEQRIANELLRLQDCENIFKYDNWEETIKETEKQQRWEFTEQQFEGIRTVLENQVTIITGYGGTGKTSIVKGMLDVLSGYDYTCYDFAQCALSGKAASRLSEVTGEEGYTIHRLLEYQNGDFTRTENFPLDQDIIIVDELSMVGGHLFLSLIKAVRDGAKLIMICDIGQLESIGVANIAKDIIDSGVIPTVKLTQIHRQAEKSAIVTESLKIRKGIQIVDGLFYGTEIRGELQDLELDIYDDKSYTARKTIQHFKEKLQWVDNILDIQVIVPVKTRGDACTFKLNKELQSIYNPFSPSKKEIKIKQAKDMEYILREGDKVINTKNNYKTFNTSGDKTPVFNGNVGIIESIDLENNIIIIDFQFVGKIIIQKKNWFSVELAYAMTVHKSQGSEFKIIIGAIDYGAYTLLNKELVYTLMTRAKKYCVLIAESHALRHAISQSNVSTKQTFLKFFLNNEMVDEWGTSVYKL